MSSSDPVVLLVMAVMCGVALAHGDDSCLEAVLSRRVRSCFSTQGLQLPSSPQLPSEGPHDASQLLRETQTVDPEEQCRHKQSYKAATNCTLSTLQSCLAVAHMEGAIPDVTRFQQGIDVICDRKAELDTECLMAQYPAIVNCGERAVRQLAELKDGHTHITDIICLSAEVHYDCAGQYLKTCGHTTMQIFLQQLDKYQVPSVCIDRSPGRPGRKRHNVTSGDRALHSVSFASYLATVIPLATAVVFLH